MRKLLPLLVLLCGCSGFPVSFRASGDDLQNIRQRRANGLRPFGLNHVVTHGDDLMGELAGKKLEAARQVGCQWVRWGVGMQHEDHDKGFVSQCAFVNRIHEKGIKYLCMIDLLVTFDPPERYYQDFEAFCRTAVKEIPADAWEIGNEPNNGRMSPECYARIVSIATGVFRHSSPAPVCAGAIGDRGNPADYMRRLRAATDQFDILSIHVYGAVSRQRVREALSAVPDKPIWITECGWAGGVFTAAAVKGAYTEYLRNPRIEAIFWYCMSDPNLPALSIWGTPAWGAYAEMETKTR